MHVLRMSLVVVQDLSALVLNRNHLQRKGEGEGSVDGGGSKGGGEGGGEGGR